MVQCDDRFYVGVSEPDLSTEADAWPPLRFLQAECRGAANTEDLGYVAYVLQGFHQRCCWSMARRVFWFMLLSALGPCRGV